MPRSDNLRSFEKQEKMRRRFCSEPMLEHGLLDSGKRLCSNDGEILKVVDDIEPQTDRHALSEGATPHSLLVDGIKSLKSHSAEKELRKRIKELEDTLETSKGAITSLANLVVLYRGTYGRLEQDVEAFDDDEGNHRGRKRTRSITPSCSEFSRLSSYRGRYHSRTSSSRPRSTTRLSETRRGRRHSRSLSSSSEFHSSRRWSEQRNRHQESPRGLKIRHRSRSIEWLQQRSPSRPLSDDMSLDNRLGSPVIRKHANPSRKNGLEPYGGVQALRGQHNSPGIDDADRAAYARRRRMSSCSNLGDRTGGWDVDPDGRQLKLGSRHLSSHGNQLSRHHKSVSQLSNDKSSVGASSEGIGHRPKPEPITMPKTHVTGEAMHGFPPSVHDVACVEGPDINGWEAELDSSEIRENERQANQGKHWVSEDGWKVQLPTSPRRRSVYSKQEPPVLQRATYQHQHSQRTSWRRWTNPALKQAHNFRAPRVIPASDKHRGPQPTPLPRRRRVTSEQYQGYENGIYQRAHHHDASDSSDRPRHVSDSQRYDSSRKFGDSTSGAVMTPYHRYSPDHENNSDQYSRGPLFRNREQFITPYRSAKRMRETEPMAYQNMLPFDVRRNVSSPGGARQPDRTFFHCEYIQHPFAARRESAESLECTVTAAATTKSIRSELAMRIESQASYEYGRRKEFWSHNSYQYSGSRCVRQDRPRQIGWRP